MTAASARRGCGSEPEVSAYLEIGSKRVFAGAIEWPGWCRSGRTEEAALETLIAYAPRYASIVPKMARFPTLFEPRALEVVERLEGNATTDFGAPGIAPAADERPLGDDELGRLVGLLRAAWEAFDLAVRSAAGAELRKGPRGGGRDLEAIATHVFEAEAAYLRSLGGGPAAARDVEGLRAAILTAIDARAHGDPGLQGRRRSPPWSPRYFIRRTAWHALDHAWEIEDRAAPSPS